MFIRINQKLIWRKNIISTKVRLAIVKLILDLVLLVPWPSTEHHDVFL